MSSTDSPKNTELVTLGKSIEATPQTETAHYNRMGSEPPERQERYTETDPQVALEMAVNERGLEDRDRPHLNLHEAGAAFNAKLAGDAEIRADHDATITSR
jgi:hypothetical protein